MSFDAALSKIFQDTSQALASTGYALFNIKAHIVCIIILAVLFNRQQNSSDQTEARVIWSRLLFTQMLYCLSMILRVLVDINIIPNTLMLKYITASLEAIIACFMSWTIFIYSAVSHKSEFMTSAKIRFMTLLPVILNAVMLIISPINNLYIDMSQGVIKSGVFLPLIFMTDLAYPSAAIMLSITAQRNANKYERENFSIMTVYPVFFIIGGGLQLLNWRLSIMSYTIIIADVLVYINYADSLVSVDPLTKIPNRNGLTRNLSERLAKGNSEKLYVFAVDIDDLSSVNSHHGHSEGDRALIIAAEALKKFRKEEHSCYAARYYGDEFIIFADIDNDEELELFTEHIRNYIRNAATKAGLKYALRVNIGFAKYEQYSRTETIAGLIGEAYRSLNENKEQKRFNNMWTANNKIPL
ncbi:MAG: GGDEF domain-containing protein [Synergistaceae bacterium]|nr:GGDEF domain-containing protein [Synergistaceae bacterium]